MAAKTIKRSATLAKTSAKRVTAKAATPPKTAATSSATKASKATSVARTDETRTPDPASRMIDERIGELGDWRGPVLNRMRELIHEADPDVVEEWKWQKATSPGTPVWSHDGIICT